MRVVKTDGMLEVEAEQRAAFAGMDVTLVEKTCLSEEALIEACHDADGILALREPLSARVINSLTRCKVISRFGVGLDTVDVAAATARGIRVTNVPDSNIEEVATHAMAMILALCRRLVPYDTSVRAGQWDALKVGAGIRRMDHITLGLIGQGRIGRNVGQKARAFGMTVLGHDPFLDDDAIRAGGAIPVTLGELLQRADIVSLHLPMTAQSANILDATRLANMRPNALVINVSRGGLLDENALAEQLLSGHLGGAAIDTVAIEPMSADHPLRQAPNVLLSPHAAHYSQQSYAEVRTKAFTDVAHVLRGEEPLYPVN